MNRTPRDPDELDEEGEAVVDLLLPPADVRVGPARRLAPEAAEALYLSAVDEVLAAREAPARTPARAQGRSGRWRVLAIAAALLLAFSLGSVASAIVLRLVDVRLLSVDVVVPSAEPPPPPRAQARQAQEAVPEAAAPETPAPPAVEPAPRPELRPARRQRPAAAPERVAVEPERVAVEPVAPEVGVVVPQDRPPEDLLALANERRRRREWREADAFYGAVASRFPDTDAAVVAEVASAALHLQHLGDARGALAFYRRALEARPSGPLAEDARWGIAEAYRSLGEPQAEALALREFLERHPRSSLAPAAERRLDRLAP